MQSEELAKNDWFASPRPAPPGNRVFSRPGRLAVISCYFNPCGYEALKRNYRRFAQGMRQQGVPLYTIELAFDDAQFFLWPAESVVQLRAKHVLWHKERLLNLLLERLPARYDKVAWIDADLLFENANWADEATQLLDRLPVVTTRSLGGRDEWFDTRYVRTVPDDPAAVAAAVQELIRLKLPPHWIRQETLRKVWTHRRGFIDLVQDIFDREFVGRDFAREWYARFTNKMGNWRSVDSIMSVVQQDCAIAK